MPHNINLAKYPDRGLLSRLAQYMHAILHLVVPRCGCLFPPIAPSSSPALAPSIQEKGTSSLALLVHKRDTNWKDRKKDSEEKYSSFHLAPTLYPRL